ncbi:Uncharacterised protein [BD1-7 clade bacterium]|uniref:Peptidase M12B domain-containing protein n=1 Tax=BD1-7 clade bacterium TaxID=2029982 RepID=A0A5S9R0Y2_9GAMM|nr:Uncharacterised protein [BD1-7 clade bacterium]
MTLKLPLIFTSLLTISACIPETPEPTPNPTTTPVPRLQKLDAAGSVLADQSLAWNNAGSEATNDQWSCVRDNDSGLVWEVKKPNSDGFRQNNSYFMNTTAVSQRGTDWDPITDGGATCTTPPLNANPNAYCDTDAYIAEINGLSFCGYTDWRLPNENAHIAHSLNEASEFLSIIDCVDFDNCNGPNAMNTDYFPNLLTGFELYWSNNGVGNRNAWLLRLDINPAKYAVAPKESFGLIRLVRGNNLTASLPDYDANDYLDDTTSKIMETAIIIDSAMWDLLGQDEAALRAFLHADVLEANKRLATLTPTIGVHVSEVRVHCTDPYTITVDGDDQVSVTSMHNSFSTWAQANVSRDKVALYSGQESDTAFVRGIASLQGQQSTLTAGPDSDFFLAHMLGHNLGIPHDGEDNICNTSNFVMTDSLNPQSNFSTCSQTNFTNYLSVTGVDYDNTPGPDFFEDSVSVNYLGCP